MSNRFLLEAKNIIKTFPPTVALNDVHFCLRPGEIHGLMGENGSGKSTMCSIVSGIYPYDSGELFLDGEPYCPKNMIDAAAKGVCMIVQEQGTFASTTVAENIFIGKEKQFHNGIRLDTKKMANAAQKILDELQMQHIDARMTCGRLSFEDRKLVEIARAMYSDPKVLIIDETTSALSKNGRDILYGLMEKMKSEGKSVIFISHDIDELMISSVEKLISAGCNMITICPCNDTMLIKVAKLCEENKVYWAVAWRDILDPEVRDVVYASPYFCGTAVQSDLNAGYEAVKAMGEAGMKKIGLISLDKSSSCAALREKGMQKALDEYGMKVVAEARDLQQAADAAQAVESFIVANPDLDGVYIACSMGMNILDGTLSALEQYDPDNHIKISVIDFLTGLDTCFEKDRIICAQGGIYIPVQIACGMLEMNAILNGGRLGGQAWDVPISFGAVGSAEEFKDYSKFCEGALPTYTFEELQNLFITYNPDVTGEDIIAWGNAFNLADIYAAHADLAAPVKGPNGVEYVPFAK